MEIRQQLSQKQKMVASQSMLQYLGLLQMSQLEIADFINAKITENPVLDRSEAPAGSQPYDQEPASTENIIDSLNFFIKNQLQHAEIAKTCRRFAILLADMLDERGFLDEGDVNALKGRFHDHEDDIEKAVETIKKLEPAGVGAFNIQECLMIQLDRMGCDDSLVRAIVSDHLNDLAAGRIRTIAKSTASNREDILAAAELISKLDPLPAAGFSSSSVASYITPDAYIVIENESPKLMLSEFFQPEISLNPYYLKLYAETTDKETRLYLKERIRQAKQLQEDLRKRRESFQNCLEYIVEVQRDYFVSGETLRPLRQKDLAAHLKVSPSTISRMIRGKYIKTDKGTFPVAYFCSPGIGGKDTTVSEVKAEMQRLIDRENTETPDTDEALMVKLADRGFSVRRRTVAKYRAELGIPRASERKR